MFFFIPIIKKTNLKTKINATINLTGKENKRVPYVLIYFKCFEMQCLMFNLKKHEICIGLREMKKKYSSLNLYRL